MASCLRVIVEVAGGEVFGAVRIGHNFTAGLSGSPSLTYDNRQSFPMRSGFTLRLH